MNKKLIIPVALIGMAVLIFVAMVIDCVRLANQARHRVELADQELVKHEQRLVRILEGSPDLTSEVAAAIERYESASKVPARHEPFQSDMPARHVEYEHLVSAFQSTMAGKIDATNPLNRKFMDDAAGAINRRQIAEKAYDEELSDYAEFLLTWQGHVASLFSGY